MIRNYANSETFKFNRTKSNDNQEHSDSDNDSDYHPEEGSENEDDDEYENQHDFENQLTEITDRSPPCQGHTTQARGNPTTAVSIAPTNWVQGENLQVQT